MSESSHRKKLTGNFISLFIVQGLNYIIPLIIFPYIIRVVGIEKFGLLSFALAFIAYPTLLVIYGLDLSGAREVASAKNSRRKLSIILSSVLMTRFILTVVAAFITVLIVFGFERFERDWPVYIITFGTIIGTMSFPVWFFQGMERMKFITYLSIASRILYLIGIFVFVRSEDDYLYVPFLNFVTLFVVGIISLILIRREFGVKLILPRFKYIKLQFIKGWHLFVSHLAINLFTSLNMLVLGLVASNLVIGYYALAEKVVKIIVSLYKPLNQALFPHVVQMVKRSKDAGSDFIKRFSVYIGVSSIVIWLVFILFGEPIFKLVFGEDSLNSISIFNILSMLIIIMPLAAWIYNVALISFKLESYFVKIFSFVALLNAIMLAIFIPLFDNKAYVVAVVLVFSEMVSLILGVYLLKRKVYAKGGQNDY